MEIQSLNRRQMFVLTAKGTLVAAAASTLPLIESCNTQQWVSIALADLPTLIQIITSILSITSVAKVGVDPSLLTDVNKYGAEVQKDLQLAQSLIMGYQSVASSAKPGNLAQIDAALAAALNNLNSILGAFHVSDQALEATIAASLGAAITMVLAIQALVPAPSAAPAVRVSLSNAQDQSSAMKAAFNLIVGKNYPSAVIK